MKTVPVVLALTLALASTALGVCPSPPPWCPVGTTCGQNLCPSDIEAVKCAIAAAPAGDTIVLSGTFKFSCMAGSNDSPLITKRLNLVGSCGTTIVGDNVSDAGPSQETGLRINAGGDLTTVSGIIFKQLDYGIDVIGSATGAKVYDVVIDGNRFEDVSLQAVTFIHCRNSVFTHNYLRIPKTGAQPYGPSGIQNFGSWDTLVEDNVFEGPGSGISQYAVTGFLDFSGSNIETLTQRLIFRSNDVSKVDYGVLTVGEHQQVKTNRFFNLGTGVGSTSALDLAVEDNCFQSFGGSAVDLGGIPMSGNGNPPSTQTSSIRNNAIANFGQSGIKIRVPSSDVTNDKLFGHLKNLVFADPSYKLSEVRVGGVLVDHRRNPYKGYVKVGPPAEVRVRNDGYPWWTGALPKDLSVKTTRPAPNTSVLHMIAGNTIRPTCELPKTPTCPALFGEGGGDDASFTASSPSLLAGEPEAGAVAVAPVEALSVPPVPEIE